jgi:hypothetical protein
MQLFLPSNQGVHHLIGEVFSFYLPLVRAEKRHKQNPKTHTGLSFQLLEYTEILIEDKDKIF